MESVSFTAGVGDIDLDGHFRGGRYLECAANLRLQLLAEFKYPPDVLRQLHLECTVIKEKIDYQRDLGLLEEFRARLTLAGISPDGSRVALRADFVRPDGKTVARVTSTCGWLDTVQRRASLPPPKLLEELNKLPMTSDYQILSNATR